MRHCPPFHLSSSTFLFLYPPFSLPPPSSHQGRRRIHPSLSGFVDRRDIDFSKLLEHNFGPIRLSPRFNSVLRLEKLFNSDCYFATFWHTFGRLPRAESWRGSMRDAKKGCVTLAAPFLLSPFSAFPSTLFNL